MYLNNFNPDEWKWQLVSETENIYCYKLKSNLIKKGETITANIIVMRYYNRTHIDIYASNWETLVLKAPVILAIDSNNPIEAYKSLEKLSLLC